ncbi:MAG TPA: methyltransferase domain-containing protein [Polyangiaceae bacterium]|nr:methyltransferase domain-containing protein [Polyangiaceae bacterium]
MNHSIQNSHYTFGDTDLAARRLVILSGVFDPYSREFITQWAPVQPRFAIDLGCGPGATTRLLHEASGAQSTLGIDSSQNHLARARERAVPGLEFECHDLREHPYSFGPAELIFARFILTHLADPAHTLAGACARLQSNPAGGPSRLLVQETSRMESEYPILSRYYELVFELQRRVGQAMYIGREFGDIAERALREAETAMGPSVRIAHVSERRFEVEARNMAELHLMNLRTWREDPVAKAAFDADELDHLDRGLSDILHGQVTVPPVQLGLGELVLERVRD